MPIIIPAEVVVPPIPIPVLPPSPVPTPAAPAVGLRSTWTGWDGSAWDLDDDTTGISLQEGVRGLAMPPLVNYRAEAPGVAGARYRGTRITSREVFWPLRIWNDTTSAEYTQLDRDFWRTLDPTKTGTWTVYQPSGEARALDLRYESDDGTWDFDPTLRGYNLYGITMIADQPYWRGRPVVQAFSNTPPVNFFGPPGVINISGAALVSTARISNDGDVPAWVTWVLHGPLDSAIVGMVNAQIEVTNPVAAGRTLTIWTQPDQMIAVDDQGYEHTLSPDAKFKSVPAGGSTTLSLSLSSTSPGGYIEASLTPYFYRAL